MPKDRENSKRRWAISDVRLVRSTDSKGLFEFNGERHWLRWEDVLPGSVEWDGQRGTLFVEPWLYKRLHVE